MYLDHQRCAVTDVALTSSRWVMFLEQLTGESHDYLADANETRKSDEDPNLMHNRFDTMDTAEDASETTNGTNESS